MNMIRKTFPLGLSLALCAGFVTIAPAQTAVEAAAQKLPNIMILATGGTIAGTGASSTTTVGYTAAKVGVDQLIEAVPELKKVANVRGEQVFQIASENMTNDHWLRLGKRVNALLAQSDVDGIVITHGTDTLEETAYFLDLVVKSSKPVVLVGAMRPSTAMSADGPINLYNAAMLAASKEAVGKGVLVAMNDQISAGRDVTKANTSTADTFRSPDLGLLGYIQGNRAHFYRAPVRRHTLETEFDISRLDSLPQVDIVYGYANVSRVAVDALVGAGAKGIIHAGVGDGSVHKGAAGADRRAPEGRDHRARRRVGSGIVARNGEANDDELDFVVADTLNPQKARMLLMLALTRTGSTRRSSACSLRTEASAGTTLRRRRPSMTDMLREAALDCPRLPTPGRISVMPTEATARQRVLALACSPGVAEAGLAIVAVAAGAGRPTSRDSLVAVITGGTAVPGPGYIGPLPSKPVMEGRGWLSRKFAGIDVFDIEPAENDPDAPVETIARMEPTFGGIGLEDIKALSRLASGCRCGAWYHRLPTPGKISIMLDHR